MFCRRCGAEIKEGGKYCPRCGTEVKKAKKGKKRGLIAVISLVLVVAIAGGAFLGYCLFRGESVKSDSEKINRKESTMAVEEEEILLPYTDEIGYSTMVDHGRGLGYFDDLNGNDKKVQYGYINQDGDWKIPMKYNTAYYFENGYACVGMENKDGDYKYGYIDENGNEITEIQYDWASDFTEEGTAIVELDDTYYQINAKGERISEKRKGNVGYFESSIQNGNKEYLQLWTWDGTHQYSGVINMDFEEIVEPQYKMTTLPLENGMTPVALYTDSAKEVWQEEWYYVEMDGTLGEKIGINLMLYSNGENIYGFECSRDGNIERNLLLNQDGDIMFSNEGFIYSPECGGKAAWVWGENYILVTLEGDRLLAEEFEDVTYFSNGLSAAVNTDGKMGYISDEGQIIIDFKYDDPGIIDYCYFTADGYAPAYKNGKLYYVTKDGQEIASVES